MTEAGRQAIGAKREPIGAAREATVAATAGPRLPAQRVQGATVGRAVLGATVFVATLGAYLADTQRIEAVSVLLAIVALALLVLTRSQWWRVAAGLLAGWCISVGASVARASTGAVLSQPWAPGRAQPAAQSLADIVFGVVGLVASTAILLAVSGALRIRRR